jgi:hypothetical protein
MMQLAAQLAYRCIRVKQLLRSDSPNSQDNLRLQQCDLPFQIAAACSRFLRLGIAVMRWTTFQDIGDKYLSAVLTGSAQHFRQQLSGSTDKWLTAPVFFRARRFANDQPVGILITNTKNCLCAAAVQWAAGTFRDGSAQLRPTHVSDAVVVDGGRPAGLKLIAGHPDINSECL